MKKKIKREIENNLLVDEYSSEDTCLEVLFTPYIDDNEVWLTYYDSAQRGYPNVNFSTFLGEEEDILIEIQNQFILFSRSCTYKYAIKMHKDGEIFNYEKGYHSIIDMDDHLRYFLIKDAYSGLLVFELKIGEDKKYTFEHVKSLEQRQRDLNSYSYF